MSILIALSAGGPLALAAQAALTRASTGDLNLGFETPGIINPAVPAGWSAGGHGYYEVRLDSVAPFAGARSLRIGAQGSPGARAFGVAFRTIPIARGVGRSARLRGYIRTEGISQGYAGLWLRTDAEGGRMLALENMGSRGVTGTTPWQAYEVVLPVDSATANIVFGVLHPGDGTAWFDSLSIQVDGHPLSNVASTWVPTPEQQAWVRRHAIPLTGVDAGGPAADLEPLRALFGSARVVALGEGTHGTSEFFRMKHRLTEFLAGQGFTVFAIEANMPEARRLNDYVLTGRGDPATLLAGMYFWTWNTREVLDLIQWMRAYNASGKGRMEFWGFDLQTPTVAMDSVRAFVARADPGFTATVDTAYRRVQQVMQERHSGTMSPVAAALWRDEAARVLSHLQARSADYGTTRGDTMEIAWAMQYARIVWQGAGAAQGAPTTSRDRSMAENVRWILDHHTAGTRAVLWAHNGHVQRADNSMGGHLDATYGSAMRVVGFALGEGEYTAVGPHGLASYTADAPPPGSVESVLRATGVPRLALDLRSAASAQDGRWLADPHDFRSIGSMALERAFAPTPVAKRFDLLIYLDRTTATKRMPNGGR